MATSLAVLALIALAACGSTEAKSTATPTTSTAVAKQSPAAVAGVPTLTPTDAQLPQLLAELKKIDPRLAATDGEGPVPGGAEDVCLDIRSGADDATAAKDVKSSRFTSSGVNLDIATSMRIVTVVKETFCH